ncbi:MAG: hypothetical protein R2843_10985 [Thermomicrobiales bacterium]
MRITEGTHGNLYQLDLSSGALTPVTPSTMHGAGSVTSGPAASRDGSKLASSGPMAIARRKYFWLPRAAKPPRSPSSGPL